MIDLILNLPTGVRFVSIHFGLDLRYHVCLSQARENKLNEFGIGVSASLPHAADLAYNQLQSRLLGPDPGRDDWRTKLRPVSTHGIDIGTLDL